LEERGVSAFAEESGTSMGLLDVTNSVGDILGNVSLYANDGWGLVDTDLNMSHVKVPKVPEDYVEPEVNHDRNEPLFEDVDNPGEWPRYCFQPKFESRSNTSQYKHHAMPTGAIPVPADTNNGTRKIDGWEFFYKGWSNPDSPYRRGAKTGDLFPKEMDGKLCAETLKHLGLTKTKMLDTDALFFLQLILPICNPSMSGIENDPRIAYYHDVERHTNSTKYSSGMGGSYGHSWNATTARELLMMDGILVRDGVLGGSQALHHRWEKGGVCYDNNIASTMTLTRFGELKRNKKLCNNDQAPKRGEGK
jgi:hypothetical protein